MKYCLCISSNTNFTLANCGLLSKSGKPVVCVYLNVYKFSDTLNIAILASYVADQLPE